MEKDHFRLLRKKKTCASWLILFIYIHRGERREKGKEQYARGERSSIDRESIGHEHREVCIWWEE